MSSLPVPRSRGWRGRFSSFFRRILCTHQCVVKTITIAPRISLTTATLMYPNKAVPMAIPSSPAGIRKRSCGQLHFPRQAQTLKTSIRQRMGNSMAAAWTGEITSAISGTETTPRPPPNPPLAMPKINTAGTATRKKRGSVIIKVRLA